MQCRGQQVDWTLLALLTASSVAFGELGHWWYDNENGWGLGGAPEYLAAYLAGTDTDTLLALATAPSAVSWGPNRLDIFAVDGNTGRLAHWWYENGWGGGGAPELLSVTLATGAQVKVNQAAGAQLNLAPPLSAVSWGPNRLDIFAVDANTGRLAHWWYKNGWGGDGAPELLSITLATGAQVNLATPPSAVSWQPNRLDIFAIDANTGQLAHWWYEE